MFSERLIDDVEKIKERSPENFFKYVARKKSDGTEPTFEEKFLRCSSKSNKFHFNSKHIVEMRADFAKIQNEVLEEKIFWVALTSAMTLLKTAKLLDRVPEKNLSPLPLDDESPSV